MGMNQTYQVTRRWVFLVCFLLSVGVSWAEKPPFSLDDLRRDAKLTPQRFVSYFRDFKFQFHVEVQDPEIFVRTRSGDCDDYGTLAAMILGEKGYTTRLVSVRMEREVHVVCYVEETRSFLDYNVRGMMRKTVASDGSLADIAQKVARSFGQRWSSVSEFTFEDGVKYMVQTVTNGRKDQPQLVAQLGR
jgi:hypothetical protein